MESRVPEVSSIGLKKPCSQVGKTRERLSVDEQRGCGIVEVTVIWPVFVVAQRRLNGE